MSSYGHHAVYREDFGGYYVLSWVVDRKYPDSRLRFPEVRRRDTDRAGALRFAERWGVKIKNDPGPREQHP